MHAAFTLDFVRFALRRPDGRIELVDGSVLRRLYNADADDSAILPVGDLAAVKVSHPCGTLGRRRIGVIADDTPRAIGPIPPCSPDAVTLHRWVSGP